MVGDSVAKISLFGDGLCVVLCLVGDYVLGSYGESSLLWFVLHCWLGFMVCVWKLGVCFFMCYVPLYFAYCQKSLEEVSLFVCNVYLLYV